MNRDDRPKGKRRKLLSAKARGMGNVACMSVGQFAKKVVDWLVNGADEDDIREFVAEFEGVPMKDVTVDGDDIRMISGHNGRR